MNAQITATEKKILDSLMPSIVDMVISGIEPIEAFKKAIVAQTDLCGELAENKSSRAKVANEVAYQRFSKIHFA